MSIWSGVAAAGIALALVFAAVANPLWEWRKEDSQRTEIWSYSPFAAHHTIYNNTTKQDDLRLDYGYDQLRPIQQDMANAFADFDQFFVLGAIAGFVGFALSRLTAWKGRIPRNRRWPRGRRTGRSRRRHSPCLAGSVGAARIRSRAASRLVSSCCCRSCGVPQMGCTTRFPCVESLPFATPRADSRQPRKLARGRCRQRRRRTR